MNMLGDMLSGNPLTTTVGQRIDKATSSANEIEDWALNMEICDIINETEEGPKEAIRAVRKKLSTTVAKDWRSVGYTLVVLETCVKNCGKRFHLQLAQKDFLNELVKIITPKNEPSVQVQEKVLGLIQTWADAFKGSPDLKAVETCYTELKNKGIEFPATDMDNLAPIHTPKQHGSYAPPPTNSGSRLVSAAAARQPVRTTVVPPGAGDRTQQLAKLREEISIVQGNCRVFNEMLNVTTTSEASPDTLDLMRELNKTCRQMQQRIVVLLEQLSDEQVTEVLLRVNDDLNNAFLRYDRVERSQPPAQVLSAPSPPVAVTQPAPQPAPMPAQPQPTESSLIDFGFDPPPKSTATPDSSSLASQLNNLAMNSGTTSLSSVSTIPTASQPAPGGEGNSDEFDMFIQSRKYDATSHSVADSYSFQSEAANADESMGRAATGIDPKMSQNRPTTTSSEFDRFLAERATAGENLPDQTANRNQRQLKKDESENALFAL